MKKKTLLVLLISIISVVRVLAQTYTLYGDKAYGTSKSERSPNSIYAGNGNILIAGYSNGNVNGDKTDPWCDSITQSNNDFWILKIDTAFNILWDKSLGGTRDETVPHIIKKNNDWQFIISGSSSSDSSCEKTSHNWSAPIIRDDYWVSVIDSDGNQLQDYSWGGSGVDRWAQTVELSSGNFIYCGTSSSPISGDKTVPNYDTAFNGYDYWVVKTDSAGNKLWDKVYGGIGIEGSIDVSNDYWFNIAAVDNDDFIIAGTTESPASGDITDTARGFYDFWIIKIDSAGHKIWDKRYGGTGNNRCNHIITTNDNGYLVCGSTDSPQGGDISDSSKGAYDSWVIKLDSLGNKQWDKRYGGNSTDYAKWAEKAPGGGYWISGQTQSDSSGDVTEASYGQTDYWILKIDDAGNKLWDKRFGGPGLDLGSTFIIMPDSSIFLFGEGAAGTSAVKTDAGRGQWDYWIVHFKYTDSLSTSGINTLSSFSNNISVFPNPAKDVVTITSASEKIKAVELVNLLGEIMLIQKVNNNNTIQLDLQAYPPGFYFVKISGADYSVVRKVIKE